VSDVCKGGYVGRDTLPKYALRYAGWVFVQGWCGFSADLVQAGRVCSWQEWCGFSADLVQVFKEMSRFMSRFR